MRAKRGKSRGGTFPPEPLQQDTPQEEASDQKAAVEANNLHDQIKKAEDSKNHPVTPPVEGGGRP